MPLITVTPSPVRHGLLSDKAGSKLLPLLKKKLSPIISTVAIIFISPIVVAVAVAVAIILNGAAFILEIVISWLSIQLYT